MDDHKTIPHFATKAIHAGFEPSEWKFQPVVPPISLASTFKQHGPGDHAGFEYARSGNPTREVLEKCIAALEGGKHGMCFASGLSALTVICNMFNSGDHFICNDDLYGGTNRYFRQISPRAGIEVSFVDSSKAENVTNALKPNTKMVWLESPTNPLLKVIDIKAVCEVVRKQPGIIVAVDNTFLSPYFQQPLELGADIAVHSLTKYMNGHTDVVMGAIVVNDDELAEKIRFLQNSMGGIPSPFDCYLVHRGLKTLHLRMREHMKNSLAVAKFLESHPLVQKVIHPYLPSHPQYEVTKKQTYGHSGMLTFYINGGLSEAVSFLKNLKIFILAESLGGYESLAEHPAIMTHASVPIDQRKELGITDNLIRLSIGLEDIEDLINDLDQALKAAVSNAA